MHARARRPARPSLEAAAALALIAVMSVGLGCKARDPGASGLLDEPQAGREDDAGDAAAAAPKGEHTLICRALDDAGGAASTEVVYRLVVKPRAATPEADEPLAVTVVRIADGGQTTVVRDEPASGALEPAGDYALGFRSGALTADAMPPQTAEPGSVNGADPRGTHLGLLTIAGDAGAQGLAVGCWLADPR
jgi:hypothetical protein